MLKNKYLWIGVVFGLIVGDLVGVALFKGDSKSASDADSALVATTSPFFVEVSDQIAGPVVSVSEMRSSATSTWLAVREQNGDLLGQILGARRVDASSATDVEIELLRPTISHLMYAVVMYEDDGSRLFEYATDTLVKVDGVPLSYPFVAN
jgi:hypothetical protein